MQEYVQEYAMCLTYHAWQGDVEEHAILLCSLLLGFRFEAYCAIGTTISGDAHMWVVTVQRHADDFSAAQVAPSLTFWLSPSLVPP